MQNYKTALITGGAGFIGSHMSHKLVNNGYKLIIVDNLFRGSLNNIKDILTNDNNKFYNIIFLAHNNNHTKRIYYPTRQ